MTSRLKMLYLWITARARRISFDDEMKMRHEMNKCDYCGESFTFRNDMYAHESECPKRPKEKKQESCGICFGAGETGDSINCVNCNGSGLK